MGTMGAKTLPRWMKRLPKVQRAEAKRLKKEVDITAGHVRRTPLVAKLVLEKLSGSLGYGEMLYELIRSPELLATVARAVPHKQWMNTGDLGQLN